MIGRAGNEPQHYPERTGIWSPKFAAPCQDGAPAPSGSERPCHREVVLFASRSELLPSSAIADRCGRSELLDGGSGINESSAGLIRSRTELEGTGLQDAPDIIGTERWLQVDQQGDDAADMGRRNRRARVHIDTSAKHRHQHFNARCRDSDMIAAYG